jgi:hypothetical protein
MTHSGTTTPIQTQIIFLAISLNIDLSTFKLRTLYNARKSVDTQETMIEGMVLDSNSSFTVSASPVGSDSGALMVDDEAVAFVKIKSERISQW